MLDFDGDLLAKMPKHIQPKVKAIWNEGYGNEPDYWIVLKDGYLFWSTDAHVEHVDTLRELKSVCRRDNIKPEKLT